MAELVNEDHDKPKKFLIHLQHVFTFAENVGISRNGKELFDGDMILTSEQEEALNSQRRSITNRRWPNGDVVYEITRSLCK